MITGVQDPRALTQLNNGESSNAEMQNNCTSSGYSAINCELDDNDIQAQLNLIAQEMERRSTNISYGLGVGLGRIVGTRDDNNQHNSSQTPLQSGAEENVSWGSPLNAMLKYPLATISNMYFDSYKKLSNTISEYWNDYQPTAHDAIVQNNVDALEGFLDQGTEITDHLFGLALEQRNFAVCDGLLNLHFRPSEEHVYTAISAKNKDVVEYLLSKNLVDLTDITDSTLLAYALEQSAFEIADLLRDQCAQLNKPVIGVITNGLRNGVMYQRIYEELGHYNLILTTLTADIEANAQETLMKINDYLQKLPSMSNRAQAILNSDIVEVKTIKAMAERAFKYCDGIWISGGANVWQGWYDKNHDRLDAQDIFRDLLEIAILDLQQKDTYKPLIGVCRGNQMINVFHGGSLKNEGEFFRQKLQFIRHDGILGTVLPANDGGTSMHHQSIDKLGAFLDTVAISNSGMVKAIQSHSKHLPLMGTQFHPEVLKSYSDKAILNRFRNLVTASKEKTCFSFELVNVTELHAQEKWGSDVLDDEEALLLGIIPAILLFLIGRSQIVRNWVLSKPEVELKKARFDLARRTMSSKSTLSDDDTYLIFDACVQYHTTQGYQLALELIEKGAPLNRVNLHEKVKDTEIGHILAELALKQNNAKAMEILNEKGFKPESSAQRKRL